jgi:hypothetical protein
VVGKVRNSQVLVNLPVTIVPRRTSSNANVFVLRHLQVPDMGASIRPPDGASVVYRRKNDLLIKQSSISDV